MEQLTLLGSWLVAPVAMRQRTLRRVWHVEEPGMRPAGRALPVEFLSGRRPFDATMLKTLLSQTRRGSERYAISGTSHQVGLSLIDVFGMRRCGFLSWVDVFLKPRFICSVLESLFRRARYKKKCSLGEIFVGIYTCSLTAREDLVSGSLSTGKHHHLLLVSRHSGLLA